MSGKLRKVDFILDRWARGETLDEIAKAEGISRAQVEAIVECDDEETREDEEDDDA